MKCVFTVVDDGSHFFDIWYKYYSKHFDEKDIYIIDVGKGAVTSGLGCNIVPLNLNIADLASLNQEVNEFKSKLLKTYKWVVFADNDEIIYHKDGLGPYIDALETEYATCRGYDIIQSIRTECVVRGKNRINLFTEDVMDWSAPVLSQRKYWQSNTIYNKTPITSIDFTWSKGQHRCDRYDIKNNTGLLLLHLKQVDYDYGEQLNKKARGHNHGFGAFNRRPINEDYFRWWIAHSQRLMLIREDVLDSMAF